MKSFRPFLRLTATVVAASFAIGTLTGCDNALVNKAKGLLSSSQSHSKAAKANLLAVRTIRVVPSNETVWVETLGETEGARQVEVRAQVSGILEAITYKEGEAVKAGQTLFIIDKAPYAASLRAAKAATHQAEASYKQAKREAERYAKLFKAQATSRKLLEDALSTKRIAGALLAQTIARQVDAQINMDRTQVKAPSDGIASRAEINQGALVNASSTLLATLTQPERLRVKFQLSERDINGRPVTLKNAVRLYDMNRREIPAKLDYVSQQVDVTTATRAMRATVLDPSHVFAGQLLSVQLAIDEKKGVFRVPQRCVQQLPDGSYAVYAVVAGKVRSVPVTVGNWKDTDWIILTGLKGGEHLVIDQLQRLRDGLPVKATLVDRRSIP